VGGDEAGFLSEGRFVIEEGVLIGRGFRFVDWDWMRSVWVNLVLVWLVGNLVWGLMVMSGLLFIR
jgi:hypothetical protein